MYDPEGMKQTYDAMEHGKAKMSAMRTAADAADREGDVSYQMYFRMEMCHESCFYGDAMDMLVVFPELLALVDRYPNTPITVFDNGFAYKDSLDHVLWIYKWVLENCSSFYQIPMEDCLNFFEDAKSRLISYGYNLRPWYHALYDFYLPIDDEKAEQAFHEFEKLPRDSNSDCKACERNAKIDFYLRKGDLEKAVFLSREIENFTLTCGGDYSAWLRMKKHFMQYYIRQKDFGKALEYCRLMERKLLERNLQESSEYNRWDDFLACYAYSDMGKALKIYKEHWKEWLNWREPSSEFRFCENICIFFQQLKQKKQEDLGMPSRKTAEDLMNAEVRAGKSSSPEEEALLVVKLPLDNTFPLYEESGVYSIPKLYDFYYRRAEELADKFDARNGSDGYRRELKNTLCTA